MASLPKSYNPIMMSLLGKKSNLIMSEVIVILLNFEFLRQHEENVSESSSALVTALECGDGKGRITIHIINTTSPVTFDRIVSRDSWTVHLSLKPVARQLPLVMMIMSFVCVDEDDVYESVGDGMCSGNGDADSRYVLDSESIFHVCPRRN
jgi:hypothetical protein